MVTGENHPRQDRLKFLCQPVFRLG